MSNEESLHRLEIQLTNISQDLAPGKYISIAEIYINFEFNTFFLLHRAQSIKKSISLKLNWPHLIF